MQRAIKIGSQIGEAPQYAHDVGVLHRDVKPSNVLLDENGMAWLSDFGLAKLLVGEHEGSLTEQGDILGTLRYMAPETFHGTSDARSDVFGLGLTLIELITLSPAYGDGSREELLQARLRGDAPQVELHDIQLPRDLMIVIRKAVEVDPELRYQTAGEFADDLKSILNDEPIRTRHISMIERLNRWARRNKVIAGLLLTTFTLLSVGLVASLIVAGHFKSQEEE